MTLPERFFREPDPSALSGALTKLAVRLVDSKCITGDTAEQLAERHDMRADLVQQLSSHYERNRREQPDRTKEPLLALIAEALPAKGWGLSQAEITWRVREAGEAVKEKE